MGEEGGCKPEEYIRGGQGLAEGQPWQPLRAPEMQLSKGPKVPLPKGRGQQLYYKAIYIGFDIDQPKQQLQEDFKNAKDLISDFHYTNPQKPGLSRDFIPNSLQEPLQS